ncbi:unnamed protein product, partial [marine sediment metagenome]
MIASHSVKGIHHPIGYSPGYTKEEKIEKRGYK